MKKIYTLISIGNTVFLDGKLCDNKRKTELGISNDKSPIGSDYCLFSKDKIKSLQEEAAKIELIAELDRPTRNKMLSFEYTGSKGRTDNLYLPFHDSVTPTGAVVIYGASQSGKTVFTEALLKSFTVNSVSIAKKINIGEPVAESMPASVAVLARQIHDCLNSHDLIIVDSFKDFIAQWPGGLTSGGISRGFTTFLSSLSSSLSRVNKTMFLVVNILTENERAISELFEMLVGTSAGFISTSDGMTPIFKDGRLKCSFRNGNREIHDLKISDSFQNIVKELVGDTTKLINNSENKNVMVNIGMSIKDLDIENGNLGTQSVLDNPNYASGAGQHNSLYTPVGGAK